MRRIGVIAALVIIGTVALAVLSIERVTRSTALSITQAAADAAALAGAASFLEEPDDDALARQHAIDLVNLNANAHPRVTLRMEETLVNTKEGTIEVSVEGRTYGLPVAVARLVGLEETVVLATATAEAQAVRCVDVGINAAGLPIQQCEGVAKQLRLIPTNPAQEP